MNLDAHLEVVEGYLDLGMDEEALAALDKIEPTENSERFQVIKKRLMILEAMQDWTESARTAREAVQVLPNYGDPYLRGAYAIRRAEGVEAALEFLKSGEHCCCYTPLWWFYMGCYHCVLGQLDEAKRYVYKAVGFGKRAVREKDLEPLWDEFHETGWPEDEESANWEP